MAADPAAVLEWVRRFEPPVKVCGTAPVNEAAAIRRRYGALLVPVHPMPAPQGRQLIDVTSFATLAKLADRYGLLVLYWTRSDVETFVVQDEAPPTATAREHMRSQRSRTGPMF